MTYLEAHKDAGLLREYTAKRYGYTLTYGGSANTYFRAMDNCKRIAKLTGADIDTVLADIRADYEAIEAGL